MKKILILIALISSLAKADQLEIIISYPPGGPMDSAGRAVQFELSQKSSESVIAFNKAGGNGIIAANEFFDHNNGNKLLTLSGATTVFRKLSTKDTFDPIDDLDIIGPVRSSTTAIIVNAKSNNFHTINDFINYAKTHSVNCGSSSPNTAFYLKALAESKQLDINVVPFKGTADVLSNIIGNNIDCGVDAVSPYVGQTGVNVIALSSPDTSNNFKAPVVSIPGGAKFDNFYAIAIPKNISVVNREFVVGVLTNLCNNKSFVATSNALGYGVPCATTNYKQVLQKEYKLMDDLRNQLKIELK